MIKPMIGLNQCPLLKDVQEITDTILAANLQEIEVVKDEPEEDE